MPTSMASNINSSSGKGLFWIHGRPGSGKSTWVKFTGPDIFKAPAKTLEIHGRINGCDIVANADTGASHNIMSARLARKLNLIPYPGTKGEMVLNAGIICLYSVHWKVQS
ncbi:hypothetical protein F5B19DRAFT_140154 [Rostrohypoxylon terebratum]|nr:hypothetical protein F5B19DRAFT_140154 [Rostrohypoxylon terebratum]